MEKFHWYLILTNEEGCLINFQKANCTSKKCIAKNRMEEPQEKRV